MSQTRNKPSVTPNSDKPMEISQQLPVSEKVAMSSKFKKKKTAKSAQPAEQQVLPEQLQTDALPVAQDDVVLLGGRVHERAATEAPAAEAVSLLTQDERLNDILADAEGDARARLYASDASLQELAYSVPVSEQSVVLAQADTNTISDASSGATATSTGFSLSTLGLAALGVGVIAGASGGGGSSSNNKPPSGKEFTLSGTIAAGPLTKVSGLVLQAMDGNGNVLKNSTGTINADGAYTFKVAAADNFTGGALRLVVKDTDADPDYMDEATKEAKDLTDGMLAVVVYLDTQASVIANVTTLTGVAAAKLANGADKATIDNTNKAVAALFGMSADPVTADIKLAIAKDGKLASNANAYGSALAILSQLQKEGVSSSAVASGLQVTADGKTATTTSSLSAALINAAQTANKNGLVPADQSTQVQQNAAGSASNPVSIAFSSGASGAMEPTGAYVPSVTSKNAGVITFSLEGVDAAAFDIEAATGKLTLKSTKIAEASVAGGKAYNVQIKAVADLGTASTADDVAVYQPLTVTVKDTVAPSAPQLTLLSSDKLNKASALSANGLFSFTPSADAAQVEVTLTNTSTNKSIMKPFSGAQQQLLTLTEQDLTDLGDGPIRVSAVAIDLAGNRSLQPSVSDISVQTSVAPPSLSLHLDNGPNPTDKITSDPVVQITGLASGGTWSYSADGGTFVVGTGQALDLRNLGSGSHTVQVKQTDAYGNESTAATLTVDLRLDAPLGLSATITEFTYQRNDADVRSEALFSAGAASQISALKGTFRGELPSNYKVELRVSVEGKTPLTRDLTAQVKANSGAWEIAGTLNLPVSSSHHGQVQIWLTDDYNNQTLISSRDYAYTAQDTKGPQAVLLQALGEASGLDFDIANLKEGSVAQYQLKSSGDAPTDGNWGSYQQFINQGLITNESYTAFVRTLDLLTGQASAYVSVEFTYRPNAVSDASFVQSILIPQPESDTEPEKLTLGDLAVRSEQQSNWENVGGHDYDTILVTVSSARVGETVYLRWGNIVKSKLYAGDETLGFQFTAAELKAQQGNIKASVWVVDALGHVSETQTKLFTVDTSDSVADVGKPKITNIRTSAASSADADKTTDPNNTVNASEARNGVAIDIALPASNWVNNVNYGNKALQARLYRTYTLDGQSIEEQVVSQAFDAADAQDGKVTLNLTASQVSAVQGGQSWKIVVRDYNKPTAQSLSESLPTQMVVDTKGPSFVAFNVMSSDTVLNAQESGIQFSVATDALNEGDRIRFTLTRGATTKDIDHYVKAGEVKSDPSGQAVLVTLSKTDLRLADSDGDTVVSVGVLDAAGNLKTTTTSHKVTVDTAAPGTVSVQLASGQDGFVSSSETSVTLDVKLAGSEAKAGDTLQLLLGPNALAAHRVTLADADITAGKKSFTVLKSEMGSDGLKQFRAYLVDAAGNQGDLNVLNVTQHADTVLDTLAHAQPTLELVSGNSPYLKNGATVALKVADAQLEAGDKVEFFLRSEAAQTAPLWKSINVTDDALRQVSKTFDEAASFADGGLDDLAEGVYTVTVKTTDKAGNVSTASKPLNLVVDRTAPDTLLSSLALSDDTGAQGPQANGAVIDFVTKTASQTLTAHLSAALKSDSTGKESLWASLDGGAHWTNVTSSVDGQTLTWATTLLAGFNDFKLEVRDQSGNVGQTLVQRYVLDQDAPQIELSGALAFSNDTAHTNSMNTAFNTDFVTKTASQTITLQLNRGLNTDVSTAMLGAGTEALLASLDDGLTWTNVTDSVSPAGLLTWQNVTLTGSSNLKFKVVDLAGNASTVRTQAYELDTSAPAALVSGIRFMTDTGASSSDFITNAVATDVKLSFTGVLAADDRVFYKVSDNASPVDVTAYMNPTDAYTFPVNLTVGPQNMTVWVEDRAGNHLVSNDLKQAYIYASTDPQLDLSTTQTGRGFAKTVFVSDAQLGAVNMTGTVQTTTVADIKQVKITSFVADANSNDERLFLSPNLDIDMTALRADRVFRPTDVRRFSVKGSAGEFWVEATASTGEEISLAKVSYENNAWKTTTFKDTEVNDMLAQLRYVNTANAVDVIGGDRSITVTLIDQAGNESEPSTSKVTVTADPTIPAQGSTSYATWLDDTRTGTDYDDILFGLRGNDTIIGGKGNDVMWGGGGSTQTNDGNGVNKGNDVFVWRTGDANNANGTPVTDTIRDFSEWKPAASGNGGSGDKLDLRGLLEGYTNGANLSDWIKGIDNHAVVNGVANSTAITIDTNGALDGGATQVIQLQGTSLSSVQLTELLQKSVIVVV